MILRNLSVGITLIIFSLRVLAGEIYTDLLSIYEISDQVGSCNFMKERSNEMNFTELSISTGKEHGAFYLPREEWLVPLKQWLGATP